MKDAYNEFDQEERNLSPSARHDLWETEMKNNKAMQEFFADYEFSSVESFIKSYLHKRELWFSHGPNYIEKMQTKGIKWVNIAFDYLKIIQQKKLFDAQCEWRAENIEIKQVEQCMDFMNWEYDVLNCPFIDPISEEEITLMSDFLSDIDKDADGGFMQQWQDHRSFKEEFDGDGSDPYEYPDWYVFYDLQKKKPSPFLLPDIRGTKEQFYLTLYFDNEKEKNKDNIPPAKRKPWLNGYDSVFTDWFVLKFESQKMIKAYKSFIWMDAQRADLDDIMSHLDVLMEADVIVPIEANCNWIEAIKRAALSYERQKTIEALPAAFEQYSMNIELGIQFPQTNERRQYDSICEMIKKHIIAGRILNGEPGDLNF